MVEIQRRSAIRQAADRAPSISGNGLVITEYRPDIIVQINGASSPETLDTVLSPYGYDSGLLNPGRAYRSGGSTVLWNGPGMWVLVCESSQVINFTGELNAKLCDTDATATELSQSRTILTLAGENVLDFLYTGCPMDLDNCEPDTCFSTQFGHFNVMIHLKDIRLADMYVYRSFGQALWDHCQHVLQEF